MSHLLRRLIGVPEKQSRQPESRVEPKGLDSSAVAPARPSNESLARLRALRRSLEERVPGPLTTAAPAFEGPDLSTPTPANRTFASATLVDTNCLRGETLTAINSTSREQITQTEEARLPSQGGSVTTAEALPGGEPRRSAGVESSSDRGCSAGAADAGSGIEPGGSKSLRGQLDDESALPRSCSPLILDSRRAAEYRGPPNPMELSSNVAPNDEEVLLVLRRKGQEGGPSSSSEGTRNDEVYLSLAPTQRTGPQEGAESSPLRLPNLDTSGQEDFNSSGDVPTASIEFSGDLVVVAGEESSLRFLDEPRDARGHRPGAACSCCNRRCGHWALGSEADSDSDSSLVDKGNDACTEGWPGGVASIEESIRGFAAPLNRQQRSSSGASPRSGTECPQPSALRFLDTAGGISADGRSIAARLESLERRFPFLGELDLSGGLPRGERVGETLPRANPPPKEPDVVDLSRLSLQVSDEIFMNWHLDVS